MSKIFHYLRKILKPVLSALKELAIYRSVNNGILGK